MEKIKLAHQTLHQIFFRLEESISDIHKAKNDPSLLLSVEDSVIKRFEICYEQYWKFFKNYLEVTYQFEDVKSPRSTFRAMTKMRICSEDEGTILIRMVGDRNKTVHSYDETFAKEILEEAKSYLEVMRTIITRIKIE